MIVCLHIFRSSGGIILANLEAFTVDMVPKEMRNSDGVGHVHTGPVPVKHPSFSGLTALLACVVSRKES
jgi:hypothetical protein